ncbi:hypothetical protein ISP15_16225 [Dyella jejuensis]|uniref:Uncharacterized protein n=1 Tax=Dyella jejuensis TaxID=1432009 RepID=A0ABW8JLA7_9GAMM
MAFSRLIVAALLGGMALPSGYAADTPAFTVLKQDGSGKALVFQSSRALKKGDVIRIDAFNAQPVTVLQLAMCDSDCPRMRLVMTLPLTAYYAGIANSNQRFVLPEDGYVSFWVQRLGGLPSIPLNTRHGMWTLEYVDPFLRFARQAPPYESWQPAPANALKLDDHALRARFYHRTFVTVRLARTDN